MKPTAKNMFLKRDDDGWYRVYMPCRSPAKEKPISKAYRSISEALRLARLIVDVCGVGGNRFWVRERYGAYGLYACSYYLSEEYEHARSPLHCVAQRRKGRLYPVFYCESYWVADNAVEQAVDAERSRRLDYRRRKRCEMPLFEGLEHLICGPGGRDVIAACSEEGTHQREQEQLAMLTTGHRIVAKKIRRSQEGDSWCSYV